MPMKHCKNCNTELLGNYCYKCGQKSKVEKITLKYLVHDVFHFFTHIESGFLFTSIQMLKAPGTTVKQFINGKRKPYQSPLSYYIIWTAIYLLLLLVIEELFGKGTVISYDNYFGSGIATDFAIKHLSSVLAVLLPIFSFYFWIIAAKRTYNYLESLVCVIYALGTIILAQSAFVLFAVIFYLFTHRSVELFISDAFKITYLLWFVYSSVQVIHVNKKLIRFIVTAALMFGTFTLWRLKIFPWIAVHFILN
jgi:hypothetical protein